MSRLSSTLTYSLMGFLFTGVSYAASPSPLAFDRNAQIKALLKDTNDHWQSRSEAAKDRAGDTQGAILKDLHSSQTIIALPKAKIFTTLPLNWLVRIPSGDLASHFKFGWEFRTLEFKQTTVDAFVSNPQVTEAFAIIQYKSDPENVTTRENYLAEIDKNTPPNLGIIVINLPKARRQAPTQ